jgi:hypothetical protein
MNEHQAIQKLLDLFADENRFTKTFLAKDISGNPVDPCDPKAYCFCIEGAIRHFKLDNTLRKKLLQAAIPYAGGLMPLTAINDYLGRDTILKILTETQQSLNKESNG